MSTFGHAWSNRRRQAYGTACGLRLCGSQHLQDSIPAHVDIRIRCLGMVFSVGPDDKSVVCMNITSLVHGMVTRTKTPSRIPPLVAVVEVVLIVVLRAWRESKVHKVSNRSLTFTTVE